MATLRACRGLVSPGCMAQPAVAVVAAAAAAAAAAAVTVKGVAPVMEVAAAAGSTAPSGNPVKKSQLVIEKSIYHNHLKIRMREPESLWKRYRLFTLFCVEWHFK